MIYYVILECETTGSLTKLIPKSMRSLLEITESWTDENDRTKHRKLCGWLTQNQFDKLIEDTNLHSESTQTMGSLTEFGHLNAICFRAESQYNDDSMMAYVSPFPQKYKKSGKIHKPASVMHYISEHQWNRIRDAVIHKYE